MPKEKINKAAEKLKELTPKQRLAVGAVILIIIIGLILQLRPPERSIASFCKTYNEENAKLPKPKDNSSEKWELAGLTTTSSDPKYFLPALTRLEKVAPEEISYDVRTLKSVYEKMDSDPSQQFAASLSGLGAESNVENWVNDHCK